MPAFSQAGATVNIAVTGTAQSLTLTAAPSNSSPILRLANLGNQTVFINFQATATVSNGIPLLANSVETFDFGAAATLSVIAGGTGSTLYATTGFGRE